MGVKVHEMQYYKHLSVYACHLETPLVYQSLKNDDLPFLALCTCEGCSLVSFDSHLFIFICIWCIIK